MKSLIVQRETVENLEVVIDASIDPTDDVIEFAFPALGTRPSTWTAGVWKGGATGSGGEYTAVAVSPTIGKTGATPSPRIAVDAGTYVVYVRVLSDLESPVIHAGTIAVR